jgi:hypothetical protein
VFTERAVSWRILLTRTIGAAIGAVIIVLFMAHVATRLVSPVSAASAPTSLQR